MQIIITPHDVIQRCLWDKYKRFCLYDNNIDEIRTIVDENKPVSLSENDAYVIGLLKVVETDNLIHRFNDDLFDFLQIKSSVINNDLFISKFAINKFITNYNNKFPKYYEPPVNYQNGIYDLLEYLEKVNERLGNLEITTIKNRDKLIEYYVSKDIKKILDK